MKTVEQTEGVVNDKVQQGTGYRGSSSEQRADAERKPAKDRVVILEDCARVFSKGVDDECKMARDRRGALTSVARVDVSRHSQPAQCRPQYNIVEGSLPYRDLDADQGVALTITRSLSFAQLFSLSLFTPLPNALVVIID